MKKFQLSLLALFLVIGLTAQELPKPSPFGSISQRVGLTDITVEYSRPGVKDRTIFGDLVPYGKMWRTGANKATQFTVSTNVVIGDQELKEGTYALFTMPGEKEWTVVFNTETEQWGTGKYDEAKNVVTLKVKAKKNCMMVETMTFLFADITTSSANLIMMWEEAMISIPIKADPSAQADENIQAKFDELDNAFRAYNSAARYYVDNGKDLDKALEWSKKSVSMNEKFWNVYTLSLIQAAKGDRAAAIATAEKSMKLAEEAEYMPYVKMNKENIAKWQKGGEKKSKMGK